ncbi:hypothetical protein BHECKSOX_2426 [Bathymodiolus heckerae thiotrophic gill symbiont]|uniref:hypothetical protein n=1 Tax=Bathymodiolus heckerae thiotrophic gill symbiont TaxID=1052212 RepID=UPI0010B5A294|nr:hypothetical protein [Bathymodiolus heckerae thiotrophic gill symbiont]CAC9546525.1 hypothetical protein [uncultured Gammaproteobacteria bacterium]SHN91925.1 hypothetical protein BHECKSOX_2426 [Bathymodiolus heckerae thiotrophic gill symbiont]
MKFIQSDLQKNNLAKTFWDIGKVILTILVLYPIAKDTVHVIDIFIGVAIAILFMAIGFYIDGKGAKNE